MDSNVLVRRSFTTGYFRIYKKYYLHIIALIGFLIVIQSRTRVVFTTASIIYQYSPNLHNVSHNYTYLMKCPSENSPKHLSVHPHQLVNMISIVLQSSSLMYCPVPKIATKTLLNIILYVHVRDLIHHVENNWTNVSTNRAQIEKMINISAFIKDLQFNGVVIPKSEMPKSAVEFLHMYLNILQFGTINTSSSSKLINPWRLRFTFAFPYFRLNNLPSLAEIFTPSFNRVIFVRHPFERLASAYKERIATLAKDRIEPEPEYDAMRTEICQQRVVSQRVRSLRPTQDSCMHTVPSFEDFLRYILTITHIPNGIARMNYHWQPYSVLCQVCKFKYNFIGKYEMFNDDLSRFLKLYNISNWNIERRNGASGLSKRDYQAYYDTLPDDLICELIKLYRDDMRLFKYRIEDYVNRTTLFQNCKWLTSALS
ncbi:unnamed protein product [Adineta ricciae]|uniref:Carbohydrate sulfotransferase n=1 Tax=Adineta ricciae TaxID=249248 RepID=A0A815L583_ADIRI|nr:unnamed protein product [Adineta ricciae]CAF1398762.1 unnamed protein product [Adineta ricciae]